MFPYIERAQQNDWEILILNPNLNEVSFDDGDGMDFGGEGGLSFVSVQIESWVLASCIVAKKLIVELRSGNMEKVQKVGQHDSRR
jgi:hypothetical protein